MGRTIAIVGFAGSSRALFNNEPPETEIWALNSAYSWMDIERVKANGRWFDIHGYEGRDEYRGEHWDKLLEMGIDIYALHPPIPVPDRVHWLDYQKICQELNARVYFTNTVAYMLAQAIWENVDAIKLYGIDMATGGEFEHQRPCCEYWIGLAEGKGIEVTIPDVSPLGKGLLYGIDRNDGFTRKTVFDMRSDLEKQSQEALAKYHAAKGARDRLVQIGEGIQNYQNENGELTIEAIHGIMSTVKEDVDKETIEWERQFFTVDGAIQAIRMLMHKFFLREKSTTELEVPEVAELTDAALTPDTIEPEVNGYQREEALTNA